MSEEGKKGDRQEIECVYCKKWLTLVNVSGTKKHVDDIIFELGWGFPPSRGKRIACPDCLEKAIAYEAKHRVEY